jgi:uncharacterized protein YjhX (UPF0386 family)
MSRPEAVQGQIHLPPSAHVEIARQAFRPKTADSKDRPPSHSRMWLKRTENLLADCISKSDFLSPRSPAKSVHGKRRKKPKHRTLHPLSKGVWVCMNRGGEVFRFYPEVRCTGACNWAKETCFLQFFRAITRRKERPNPHPAGRPTLSSRRSRGGRNREYQAHPIVAPNSAAGSPGPTDPR